MSRGGPKAQVIHKVKQFVLLAVSDDGPEDLLHEAPSNAVPALLQLDVVVLIVCIGCFGVAAVRKPCVSGLLPSLICGPYNGLTKVRVPIKMLDHSTKLSCSTWQSVWPSKDLCCLGKWICTMWLEAGRIKHGFLSSVGQSVGLLTSRSGVRASQKACVALPVMNQQRQGPRTFMGIQGAKL